MFRVRDWSHTFSESAHGAVNFTSVSQFLSSPPLVGQDRVVWSWLFPFPQISWALIIPPAA